MARPKTRRVKTQTSQQARLKEVIDAVTPLLTMFTEHQRQNEERRLQVFKDAFGRADNEKQRVALAVAYLGGARV